MIFKRIKPYLIVGIFILLGAVYFNSINAKYTDKTIVMGMVLNARQHRDLILKKKFPMINNAVIEEYIFIDKGVIMVNRKEKAMVVVIFNENNEDYFCYGIPYEPIASWCPVKINTSPLY